MDTSAQGTGAAPRLLLVEDDAAIRQFVAMALEDLPIQLQACPTLAAARAALREPPAPFMVLLDLMLPDGRGQDLLAEPEVRQAAGQAEWVVFSAGVPDAARASLHALGVAEVLRKPVALDELLRCVERRLAARAPDAVDPPASRQDDAAPVLPTDGSAEAEAWATAHYFEGQASLFSSMKALSQPRLSDDRAALEAALCDGHLALARRLAHNLRSTLSLLGRPNAARAAEALEGLLATDPSPAWGPAWERLQAAWSSTASAQAPTDAPTGAPVAR